MRRLYKPFCRATSSGPMVPPCPTGQPQSILLPRAGSGSGPTATTWMDFFYGAVETAPVIQHLAPLPLLASTNNCDLNQRYNLPLLPMNVIAGPVANQGETAPSPTARPTGPGQVAPSITMSKSSLEPSAVHQWQGRRFVASTILAQRIMSECTPQPFQHKGHPDYLC